MLSKHNSVGLFCNPRLQSNITETLSHTNTAEKHREVHDPNGPPPALVRVIVTIENECL